MDRTPHRKRRVLLPGVPPAWGKLWDGPTEGLTRLSIDLDSLVKDATSVILGMSTGFHDSAASLLVDGEIVAAVEQERLSRVKHDSAFPGEAAATCLAIADLTFKDVDLVSINEKPIGVLHRYLASRLRSGPRGLASLSRSFPELVREHLLIGRKVDQLFRRMGSETPPVAWVEHHLAHAAAAFYPSPFESAAVLTLDGVGEWATATIAHGAGTRLVTYDELWFPDSVGMLYSAFTAYCGFRVNSGEGELMGLAPYGRPRFAELIREKMVDLQPDGSIRLDQRYFSYLAGRRTTSRRFHQLFDGEPRPLGSEPTQREADLAASIQEVTEQILLAMVDHALLVTGESRVCMAGGVALNCVANGKLSGYASVDDVWIQPAAGDAGGGLGAALYSWHELGNARRRASEPDRVRDRMRGSLLGPSFDRSEICEYLDAEGVPYELPPSDQAFLAETARWLAEGRLIGWFAGPMEFGPRALGSRSILADARRPEVQPQLNLMVKERQSFRPFAPAVLAEDIDDWFEVSRPSPYKLTTAQVAPKRLLDPGPEPHGLEARTNIVRSEIPSCTHVDGSARVQSVRSGTHPRFHQLLTAFKHLTGCPVLLNTSFNGRAEPIVCTPSDALRTAQRIRLDGLAIEGLLIDLRSNGTTAA